ncbi:MAG: hypothetical protein HFF96_10765 [Oscillibacter sp.]|uniref:hypothetical protein n=1 Tax=Oscillibacter sp. TaxID=1945593 RepID=UPI00216F8B6B|nr:hypothetical protein [Oscillibacter sp.]MCI9114713.1 hypothetical protein [Oscillibacter sp.]
MKLWKRVFILTLCLLLTACAPAAETPESPARTEGPAAPADPAGVPPSLAEDEEPTVLTCRVVDGAEDGNLLLAELDEGLYGGTGVYRLNVKDVPVTLDGEAAEPSVLEDGMAVDVAFNGHVLESFPAQLGEVYSVSAWSRGRGRNGGGTMFDLCGLYLQVLDDLWKKDPALNEDVSQIALDLSQAPGELTEGEKLALVHRFGELHGVEAFAATFEELKEQGYLTSEPLGDGAPEGAAFVRWEDGCLFSITPSEDHEGESYSLPTLFFNAEKWRSSLGAYGFYDCSAGWGQVSTWNGYQVGSEMIS